MLFPTTIHHFFLPFFFAYLKWKYVTVLNVSYMFSRMEISMPCNDRNYSARHGLGIKECINTESQARFFLQKNNMIVLMKNVLGPN